MCIVAVAEIEIWAWCSRLGRTKRARILLQVRPKQEEGSAVVSECMKATGTINMDIKKNRMRFYISFIINFSGYEMIMCMK